MSNSVRPHRQQPTRLYRLWDSPGKNTVVGCHFRLQSMKVKSESEGAQSCLTLRHPMDCSLPGSSVHGILQARVLEWGAIAFSELSHQESPKILEWVAYPFSRESSQARNQTGVSCIAGGFFTSWATRSPPSQYVPIKDLTHFRYYFLSLSFTRTWVPWSQWLS